MGHACGVLLALSAMVSTPIQSVMVRPAGVLQHSRSAALSPGHPVDSFNFLASSMFATLADAPVRKSPHAFISGLRFSR